MGALEYEPSREIGAIDEPVDLDALTKLASEILSEKENIHIEENDRLMSQLMECSSSVGGARAKTLIAWNPETNDIRSGQIEAGKGYEYWLLKFDDIKNNRDKGHISLLHSYHRKRVKEEDVLPFGKKIGLGTIIVGCTVIIAGISELFFSGITNIILVVGFVPGFSVMVYALLKYNKGIF